MHHQARGWDPQGEFLIKMLHHMPETLQALIRKPQTFGKVLACRSGSRTVWVDASLTFKPESQELLQDYVWGCGAGGQGCQNCLRGLGSP